MDFNNIVVVMASNMETIILGGDAALNWVLYSIPLAYPIRQHQRI